MPIDELKRDLERMEAVCIKTAQPTDIWQDRCVYWMAVAIMHILTWIIRREERNDHRDC